MAEDKTATSPPASGVSAPATTATVPGESTAPTTAGAIPQTSPIDPSAMVLMTNPALPGGAVTAVPRRSYDDLWRDKGYVIVEDDADVVAALSGQVFLKEKAVGKYTDVTQDGVKSATAAIANSTVVTPGEVLPGTSK